MSDWFASGRVVDLVLLVLAVEALAIARFAGGRRSELFGALLPGLFLLLALRAALTDAPWPLIALLLAAALPSHLIDLKRRLR
ncbi:hypothetical protein [Thermaurantiacus sp.]